MLYSGPLLQPLLKLVESDPGFVVLYGDEGELTADQLLRESMQAAASLREQGFKEDDIAVIAAQPGAEFLQVFYAILLLRGKIAIIDPEMGRENYASKMKQLQPQWMFIDSRLLLLQEHPFLKWTLLKLVKKIPDIRLVAGMRLVSVGRWLPIVRRHLSFRKLRSKPHELSALTDPGSITENVITYTSGTLSTPKGVLHSSSSLSASIGSLCNLFAQEKGAIVGTYLPHFMLLGIAAGLPVKLMKADLPATQKMDFIRNESIGILFGPPSDYLPMIIQCEQAGQKLPESLQHVLIGSAPAHTSFLKRLMAVLPAHTRITCTYGMTENLLVAVIDGREKAGYMGEGDILGKPVAGVEIRIEEDGEILVKSPQLFSRYFHEQSRPEWHASGDLGKIDAEGNIILMGRKKEMIIRRNMNIYPALYENTIKHIKGIEEAAMVGIYNDDTHDEKVYLALEGSDINVASVKRQLAQGKHSIDAEAIPDEIITMTIPRKGRQNKIDRASIIDYIRRNKL